MATPEPARPAEQRKRDVLAHLTGDIDLWLATASPGGDPYLVPLSFVWHEGRIVLATPEASPTVTNLRAVPRTRAALGATRDVVLVEGTTEIVERGADTGAEAAFAAHVAWDPAPLDGYVYISLRPERIMAWREANELAGRTVMRAGAWLV